MNSEILKDLGLTNAEIKIYLALLGLGTSTAGPIIRKTGLQNSVVHSTFPKLIERGFVKYIKKGGVRQYTATNPKNILKFIDEKRSRFEKILPQLLAKQQKVPKQEAEVYHGFKGLKTMLYELIEDSKKGDEYLFFTFDTSNLEDYEKVYEFYRVDFHEERKKKGIIEKGLASSKLKKEVEKAGWTKKSIKFTDFPIPSNISVFQDKVAFTPWDDEEICFLVHSKQLAESFRAYFYSVWNSL